MTQVCEEVFDKDGKNKSIMFWCDGCNMHHSVYVAREDGREGPLWTWNGSLEKPTFKPSVNVMWQKTGSPKVICHSWVTDGKIEYLSDCTHALKDQIVDLRFVD